MVGGVAKSYDGEKVLSFLNHPKVSVYAPTFIDAFTKLPTSAGNLYSHISIRDHLSYEVHKQKYIYGTENVVFL